MELIKCEVCGHDLASDARVCPNCGHPSKPPIAKRAISNVKQSISNVKQAIKSDGTRKVALGCRNVFIFSIKLLCILILNSIIFSLIFAIHKSNPTSETYIGCMIAISLIQPITFAWWILIIIGKHFGDRARFVWAQIFLILMVIGSFGPFAIAESFADVLVYIFVRVGVLLFFYIFEIEYRRS